MQVCNSRREYNSSNHCLLQFIAHKFNRGLPQYQPFLHKYDKSGAVKVKHILGITHIHDIEYLENGYLSVWRLYNICPGEIHKKEDIDKLYKTVATTEGKKKGGGRKIRKVSQDRPTEEHSYLDASKESAAPPTTEESGPS